MTKAKKKMPVYRTYRFMDKDPIIDRLRTLVKDSGRSYQSISDEGGPSVGTLGNWFNGGTRRPQFCTVMATFRTLGKDLTETNYSLRNGHK